MPVRPWLWVGLLGLAARLPGIEIFRYEPWPAVRRGTPARCMRVSRTS